MPDTLAAYLAELQAKGRFPTTIRTHRSIVRRWLCSGEEPAKFLGRFVRLDRKTQGYYRFALSQYLEWCVAHGHIDTNPLRPPPPVREPHPLDSPRETYLLELAATGHSPGTIRDYRQTIRRWQQSGLEPQSFLMRTSCLSSTRRKEGLVLRRFLGWSVSHAVLTDNPLAGVKFRAGVSNLVRPFSEEEIDRLLDACGTPRQRGIVTVLVETGLRASELANIRIEKDIDRSSATLVIQRGKGGKSRRLALGPATVEALEILATKPMAYHTIYLTVRLVGVRAGIDDVHPHRFRHTFAHRFLAAGGDRGDLRVLLGHTSYTMVDHYCAYWEEERAIAAHRRFMAARESGRTAAAI
jgi:integrase